MDSDNGENWVSAVLGTCDEIFRHMASVAYREEPKRKKTSLCRRLAPLFGRGLSLLMSWMEAARMHAKL
jgi:hypothetical protein